MLINPATRNSLGLDTDDSPVFVNVKLSSLTDTYVPYHKSDTNGLADSNVSYNLTDKTTTVDVTTKGQFIIDAYTTETSETGGALYVRYKNGDITGKGLYVTAVSTATEGLATWDFDGAYIWAQNTVNITTGDYAICGMRIDTRKGGTNTTTGYIATCGLLIDTYDYGSNASGSKLAFGLLAECTSSTSGDSIAYGVKCYAGGADTNWSLYSEGDACVTTQLTIGDGSAGYDPSIAFNGETNDSLITWMEDEDYVKFADDIHFGDGTNYLNISDTDGAVTWGGTFLKKITLRPNLIQSAAKVAGVPTEVYQGLNIGYSLPIWTTPAGANEQLGFRMRIPVRWDGVTDPQVGICVTLSAAEDVGDKFKFQLEWQTTDKGNEMGTTTSSTTSEQTVLTGRAAAYDTYFVYFTLDANDVNNPLTAGIMLQARLRRIAASSSEVSNEIIVWDWAVMWPVKYVYGNWSVSANDA